eukprot:1931842-Pleurochrysis_carterae.AAC.1
MAGRNDEMANGGKEWGYKRGERGEIEGGVEGSWKRGGDEGAGQLQKEAREKRGAGGMGRTTIKENRGEGRGQ